VEFSHQLGHGCGSQQAKAVMPAKLTMSASDWALLLLLSLLWGGSFFFAEIALEEIPPLTLALLRVALAAAILFAYVRARGLTLPAYGPMWGSLAVMAVLNNVAPFTLIFWSQTHIGGGLASILNATTPLFTIMVAHFATQDDRITPARLVGLVAGFLGVLIVIGADALRELGVHVVAQLASLLAAFCYALSGVYGRRFRGLAPAVLSACILLISTIVMLPLVAVLDRPWMLPLPSAGAIAATIAIAAISTAFAYLIYFRVLARAGATNLLLVTFLIPVSAILLGVLFLDETLELRHMLGMAAIAVGLAAIDGRPQQILARRFNRVASRA
jgi:drug/metabolite transporter (DMT)-like permease